MKKEFLLCIAVLLLFMGHIVKVLRWRQFVNVYEISGRKILLRSLTYGYLINFIFPFRIGDLFRAFWAGRRMKNGVAFSLATVILDRCLDVWAVGLILSVLFFVEKNVSASQNTIMFYIILAICLMLSLMLTFKFSRPIKKTAKRVCSIFNEKIELTLLVFLWSGITAVKDMLKRMSKMQLLCSTVCMWVLYLLSYYVMSVSLYAAGFNISFSDILILLFDSKQLNMSAVMLSQSINGQATWMISSYILLPLLLMLAISMLPSGMIQGLDKISGAKTGALSVLHLLPQVEAKDKLDFLEKYFETEDKEYLDAYIRLNRDILILADFSAGSKATTMLCMDGQTTFYRKYAFGSEADKLFEQVDWLEAHKLDIPLPEIHRPQKGQGYCCYDMSYYPTAIGMFQYLHSTELTQCWNLLKTALQDLRENVHQKHIRSAEPGIMEQYIDQKVLNNLVEIEQSHELEPLLQYETLVINGKTYLGYGVLKQCLTKANLMKIFQEDEYADIHGDLTIENIVCWERDKETTYYLIDPNTGNLHDSPFLDYGKLLQSLHGGYEFLMRTGSVEVEKNKINFLSAVSRAYSEMFQKYHQFLEENFTPVQVRSIYFHEIVHWLRLLPYKIEKNGKRAVLFFSGLIIVFNDIIDWYGDIKE